MTPSQLVEHARTGDRRALAKVITAVENGAPWSPPPGEPARPHLVGVTGPPGVGKSTLIDAVILILRARGDTVGVLAVDPSSPLTGGALLGDRIRMQRHAEDPGVYIRSMANRSHLGGLAPTSGAVIRVLSSAGFDHILVETVGVGQSEVEVMDHVDTVVLVVAPGWGDRVQAEKAGVVEIAHLVVVNKADLAGAEEVRQALTERVREDARGWKPDVVTTVATSGDGIDTLVAALDDRASFLGRRTA